MPEICHSFVSRYAAIASAARNERGAPCALGEFLEPAFSRAIHANRKCISVHMYTVYHKAEFAQHEFVF
jgi:hypothetical protein